MMKTTFWCAAVISGFLGLAPFAAPAFAADEAPKPIVEQSALTLLKKMSDTLASAQVIQLGAIDFRELPTSQGQMITAITTSEVIAERPNKFRADAVVNGADTTFVYDGKTFTAFDHTKNLYVTAPLASGQIEEFFKKLGEERGIEFAVADFLSADPYAVLTKNLVNAYDAGPTTIDGQNANHLVFSAPGLEWQLWLDAGNNLPIFYAATYTDAPREPRFMVNFRGWNLKATPSPEAFAFTPPAGASSIDFLPTGQN